jgi:hypothetical protein
MSAPKNIRVCTVQTPADTQTNCADMQTQARRQIVQEKTSALQTHPQTVRRIMQTCTTSYLDEFLQTERVPQPRFHIGEKVIHRWTSEEDGIERIDKGTIVGLVHLPACDHALVPL